MVMCIMLTLGHCKNVQQIQIALFLVVPCYFCVCAALNLELVLPAQFTLELATQQAQACNVKCYQLSFINGLNCFFQNLKLKASTTPNIYVYIFIYIFGFTHSFF